MNWKVPVYDLKLTSKERDAVLNVLKSNWLTSGPKTIEFEQKFQNLFEKKTYAIALSSATAALHLSLILANVGKNDEVILPSMTFVSCANVVLHLGAKPVFADISSANDWTISPDDIEQKITSKTKAIMIVHFAGYSCDMEKIVKIAKKYNLKIIEDCSHAPNSYHAKGKIGTFGIASCFSFYSNKNITTAEGGMLLTKSKSLYLRAKSLRTHGITTSTYGRHQSSFNQYDVNYIGYNYRIDEMRSSLGIVQLDKIEEITKKRKVIVNKYIRNLKKVEDLINIPFQNFLGKSSYHLFIINIKNSKYNRNQIIEKMSKFGIQCSVHYKPIHKFTAYKNYKTSLPLTEFVGSSNLTLPLFPHLTDSQINYVTNSLSKCLK